MSLILDKLAAFALPITLAALVASSIGFAGQTVRLSWAHEDLAEERASRETERAAQAEAARKATAENARLAAAHAARQQEMLRAYNDALRAEEIRVAAAAADAASLRDAVECYASGRCIGPGVDAATGGTCPDRAATLGKLFGRADTIAGRMARAADKHADEVRALKGQILADREACGGR